MVKAKSSVIEVNEKNCRELEIKTSFEKRFNFSLNNDDKNIFKNRCLAVLQYLFKRIDSVFRDNIIKQFNYYLCMQLGIKTKQHFIVELENMDIYNYLERLDINNKENYFRFIYILELILNYYYPDDNEYDVKYMINQMAEVIKLSNERLIIYKEKNKYEIYPLDNDYLNEKLIFDILSWLNDYPKSKDCFSKAIKEKRTLENCRNIVDNLRLSLELFLKDFLKIKSLWRIKILQ